MRMDLTEPTPTLNFLHDVSTRIAAADPLHEVLDEIVEFVSDLVSCDSCFIYVKDHNELVLRASKNSHPEVLDVLKMPVGEGITGWVAENNQAIVLSERAWQDARFRKFAELPEDAYEAFLSIPVSSRGNVVGVINVQHKDPYPFSAREIKIISTLGHLVGTTIERVRLEEEVSELSGKLAARKLVERAKGVIQRELGISEEEAYSMLQKQARQRRKSMKEISEAILLADEMKRASK